MQTRIAEWQHEFTHWSSFSLMLVEEHRNKVICFVLKEMRKRGSMAFQQKAKTFPKNSRNKCTQRVKGEYHLLGEVCVHIWQQPLQ